jgi:hypothetical protein
VRVDELMDDADFLGDVLGAGTDENGAFWPVVKLPYRLHRTPGKVATVAGVGPGDDGLAAASKKPLVHDLA